jgi:hypothetical protein
MAAECTRDRRNPSPEWHARLAQVRRKFSKYMISSSGGISAVKMDGVRSLWLGGGVRSRMRTSLRHETRVLRELTGQIRECWTI